MLKLRGVLCPLATPFNHRGELYPSKIRHNVGRLNLTRLSGYVVGTSVGEGPLLSFSERGTLLGLVRESMAEDRLLVASVSAESVSEAIAACTQASEIGCDAVWLAPPRCYGLDQTDPSLHFRATADRSPAPLIAAEIENGTVSAEELGRLAAHPNIAAVSLRGADTSELAAAREAIGRGARLLTESEAGAASALESACDAAVLALANAIPFHLLSIEEAVRGREASAAGELEQRTRGAAALMAQLGPAGLKFAMDLRGCYGGAPRLPLRSLDSAAKTRVEGALEGLAS